MMMSILLCAAMLDGGRIPTPGPDVAELSGFYHYRGTEPSGTKYSGIATITKRGEVYVISWSTQGGSSYTGIAIRQGDKLTAGWGMPKGEIIVRGVTSYRIESTKDGPVLNGRWATIPGNGKQQSETLTFLKALDPEEKEEEP